VSAMDGVWPKQNAVRRKARNNFAIIVIADRSRPPRSHYSVDAVSAERMAPITQCRNRSTVNSYALRLGQMSGLSKT
jgi:hypothetical protein